MVEVESGKSEVFPAWSSRKDKRRSGSSKWCKQTKKRGGNKGPLVVLRGVDVEM